MNNKGLSEFTATIIIVILTIMAFAMIYVVIKNVADNQPMTNYSRMETKAYCPLANLTNTTLYCTDYMIFYDWNDKIINFTATPYSIQVPIELKGGYNNNG